jgi:hypothetical protein
MEEVAKLFSRSPLKITAVGLIRDAKESFEKTGNRKGAARMEKLLERIEKELNKQRIEKPKELKKEKEIQKKVKAFEKKLRKANKIRPEVK